MQVVWPARLGAPFGIKLKSQYTSSIGKAFDVAKVRKCNREKFHIKCDRDHKIVFWNYEENPKCFSLIKDSLEFAFTIASIVDRVI